MMVMVDMLMPQMDSHTPLFCMLMDLGIALLDQISLIQIQVCLFIQIQ